MTDANPEFRQSETENKFREFFKDGSVTIIYRDNKTLPPIVEKMKDRLIQRGVNIDVRVFPMGTPEEEIRSEYEKFKGDIKGDIIADQTFERSTGEYPKFTFEDLEYETTSKAVLGVDWKSPDFRKLSHEQQVEMEGRLFSAMFRKAQEKSGNKIKRLYIVEPLISDHFPSSFDLPNKGVSSKDGRGHQPDTEYAAYLKEWANSAGIADVQIVADPVSLDKLTQEEAYMLYDGHATPWEWFSDFYGFEENERGALRPKDEKTFDERTIDVNRFLIEMDRNFGVIDGAEDKMPDLVFEALQQNVEDDLAR